MSDDEEDEDYLPEGQSDEESHSDADEDISIGDNRDNEGPTEEDGDDLGDDSDEEAQDENNQDEYNVGHEMDNTQDLGAGRSENSGVSETKIIGVDRAEHEMIHQVEESGDEPELYKDSETSSENDEKEETTMDELNLESSRESRYNLHDKRTRSYKHLYSPWMFQIEDSDDDKREEVVLVTANDAPEDTPQMSMKQGLRMFGEEGYAAVRKEMQQLHD